MNKDKLIGAIMAMVCVIAVELIMPIFGVDASIVGMLTMLLYYVLYFAIVIHKEAQAELEAEKYKRLLDDEYLNELSYKLKRKRKEELLDTLNDQISDN